MASSLRNAVKRVAHKERSQPISRQHLGILEKKKDYKKRAIDFHQKEDRIKAMREKANNRNPDEFYFGMHNSQVKDGKHKKGEDYRDLPPEMVQLMKDQDLSYVRMQKQKDNKKAERLQASLHLLGRDDDDDDDDGESKAKKRKHTIFVDSQQEADEFDVAEHFDTLPELAGRSFNRLRKADVEKLAKAKTTNVDDEDEKEYQPTSRELEAKLKVERRVARKIARSRNSAYGEMEARLQRAKQLQQAEDHLVTEKLVAGKGRKRKIKGAEDGKPAQYKWRRKRLG
jgi:U3 small nucleolar RNA-associated protein 11